MTSDRGTTGGSTGHPSNLVSEAPRAESVPLRSLTPRYRADDHGTYLRRLEEAVKDPDNLNIALTGRYGAGKSSVLNEFRTNHRKSVEQLSISTLAPGEDGETTTNRIQKAIVKHLLYGASKKVGKNSRFSRIAVLSTPRALARATLLVACIAVPLYLFDWYPAAKWTGPDEPTWHNIGVWAAIAAVAIAFVSLAMRALRGRSVSDVTAGPAAVGLTEKTETPFDAYTDEIVHYFDTESKDIVLIEDLDRFEDEHIFEALRELNLLLNNTPRRRAKRRGNLPGRVLRWTLDQLPGGVTGWLTEKLPFPWATRILGLGVPLGFVYAVKDSIFEKIDSESAAAAADTGSAGAEAPAPANGASNMVKSALDAVAVETQRANRTKFFDIVIPLVPFISHRNARELLADVLKEAGITNLGRRLINIVARYSTDMRMLHNICNEYLLFAERLLDRDRVAPGLDPDKLFALVVYKNFHLSDFENITRGESRLDRLYDLHQHMVRDAIAAAENAKADQRTAPTRARKRKQLAEHLGNRLTWAAGGFVREFSARQGNAYRYVFLRVAGRDYTSSDASTPAFWEAAVTASTITVLAATQPDGGHLQVVHTLDEDDIAERFPEAHNADAWVRIDTLGTESDIERHDRDILDLRRADFADLATMPRFTLNPSRLTSTGPHAPIGAAGALNGDQPENLTFAALVDITLTSRLGRDLVKRGFIDRNFSLYAAQFYGHFSGPDVATFMVRHVQPNTMNIHYDLSRHGAAANVLTDAEDAGDDLLRTVAAYNIDLVNHLLTSDNPGISEVIRTIRLAIATEVRDAADFVSAFFASDTAEREKFAAALAENGWEHSLTYLATSAEIPDNLRPGLFSAALLECDTQGLFAVNDAVGEFILGNYAAMDAFTATSVPATHATGRAPGDRATDRVARIFDKADVSIPNLAPLDPELLRHVVAMSRYDLTADNIRTAAGTTGDITLDAIASSSQTVYKYCLDRLDAYLAAISADTDPHSTDITISGSNTLAQVLRDLVQLEGTTPTGRLGTPLSALVSTSDPSASLRDLHDAPAETWPVLAASNRFQPWLANVDAYRTDSAGPKAIDTSLAGYLARASTIATTDPDTGQRVDLKPDGQPVDRVETAVAILNTTDIGDPATRVAIAQSISPALPLSTDEIDPEPTEMFARLLAAGMVEDNAESFDHFAVGGWDAIRPAIAASNNIETFLEPSHIAGMVTRVFADIAARKKIAHLIVKDLDRYVPDEGDSTSDAALRAAAEYAHLHGIALAPDTAVRIANAANTSEWKVALSVLSNAYPTCTSDDVLAAFRSLGHPFNQIDSGAKFDLPKDADGVVKALLDKLPQFRAQKRPLKEEWSVTPA